MRTDAEEDRQTAALWNLAAAERPRQVTLWADASVVPGSYAVAVALRDDAVSIIPYCPPELRPRLNFRPPSPPAVDSDHHPPPGMGVARNAGPFAASFSAESVGIEAATDLAVHIVQSGEPVAAFRFPGDALSAHLALRRGPLAQQHFALKRAWDNLLWLARRGISSDFPFVFGHCGICQHDRCDAEAKRLGRVAGHVKVASVWFKDAARARSRAVQGKFDAVDAGLRSKFLRGPTTLASLPLLPVEYRTLCQLRCGACRALGGWRHDAADACMACGTPDALTRGGGAVTHVFECPLPAAVRHREEVGLQVQDLWKRPVEALRYVQRFFLLAER